MQWWEQRTFLFWQALLRFSVPPCPMPPWLDPSVALWCQSFRCITTKIVLMRIELVTIKFVSIRLLHFLALNFKYTMNFSVEVFKEYLNDGSNSPLVKSNLVKLETSHTVILSHTVSVLWSQSVLMQSYWGKHETWRLRVAYQRELANDVCKLPLVHPLPEHHLAEVELLLFRDVLRGEVVH